MRCDLQHYKKKPTTFKLFAKSYLRINPDSMTETEI